MGRISLDLKDGEGVVVSMSCVIKIKPKKGKGRNRRRCVILFNGHGKVRRIKLERKSDVPE
ncbi:hypothetical protein [Gimesia algae]|uniref:Uncharacterized protein n=1 Tax=Gimesia algae TaxID=2527971 RepID=A0A517VMQ4_9PLAN|nr:hypothetical protein [Gimesia algae]QDT94292.1 hypothetical protein Pan161_59870 [Gimesia algae]